MPAAVVRPDVRRDLAEGVVFPALGDAGDAMHGVGAVAVFVVSVRGGGARASVLLATKLSFGS